MLKALEAFLRPLTSEGIALAFSGGVDSMLLLAVLQKMSEEKSFPLVALTMKTVLQDERDMSEAKQATADLGVKSEFLSFNPFDLEVVRNNRRERCYFCKKAIFEKFVAYAKAQGLKHVLDGTNADDLKVYRPGRKALQELGIISPLAEVGLTKADIRALSAELGLKTASKPAVPCLATRFPYDTYLDDAALARVAKGETELKKMLPKAVDFRLRVHGNLARLEVAKEKISDVFAQYQEIVRVLKKIGFDFVTLDLEGFRSGSFDRAIEKDEK